MVTLERNSRLAIARLLALDRATLSRFAGLRRKEIALMEWRDVDLEERTIFVRHTKGYRSRVVPLGERLSVALGAYEHSHRGRLFQLQPNGVSQVIQRLCDRAGAKLHIHQFATCTPPSY